MKSRLFLASAVVLALTGGAQAFVPVPQKEYDAFARCFAQQVGASELLKQNVVDWTEVYGADVAQVQEFIDSISDFAALVDELSFYMGDLLDELSHPAYALDHIQAEAVYQVEIGNYQAILSQSRGERMAFVDSDEFVVEVSDLCMSLGETIETTINTNLESGAVAWE